MHAHTHTHTHTNDKNVTNQLPGKGAYHASKAWLLASTHTRTHAQTPATHVSATALGTLPPPQFLPVISSGLAATSRCNSCDHILQCKQLVLARPSSYFPTSSNQLKLANSPRSRAKRPTFCSHYICSGHSRDDCPQLKKRLLPGYQEIATLSVQVPAHLLSP